MRNVMGFAALSILLAGPAAAATDHNGAWHSVEAKSSWSNGKLPTGFSLEINIRIADGKIVYHSLNDTDKTKVGGLDFTTTLDGKPFPIENQARFDQVTVRQPDPNTLEILELKDGDVVVGSFWTFAPDGKSFVRRGVGKSPDGKSKAFEEYFEKVK